MLILLAWALFALAFVTTARLWLPSLALAAVVYAFLLVAELVLSQSWNF